ncbi:MAG: Fe-S cluster assembly protein SufD [Hyphomicrobiales bacterium]
MNIPLHKTAAEMAYIKAGARSKPALAKAGWIEAGREAALRSFSAHGLPNRRVEEWKWTDLRRFLSEAYPPGLAPAMDRRVVEAALAPLPFATVECRRLIFIDGHFAPQCSDALTLDGVEFHALRDVRADPPSWAREVLDHGFAPYDRDVIDELNTLFVGDGALIRIARETEIAPPIHLAFVNSGVSARSVAVRNVVALGEGARAAIIETHSGREATDCRPYLASCVTETVLGRRARLDHVKLQADNHDAIHLSNRHFALQAESVLRDVTLGMGAKLARNQVFLKYCGEEAGADIAGACLLNGKQHCDTTIVVNHDAAECRTREVFKYVMEDAARGVFQGRIMVAPHAQGTDAKQQSHGLLLSGRAEFDAKPELEIFADNVACGHGATAGALDEEQLFYLHARGIPQTQAKSLLIAAFVNDVFATLGDETMRQALAARVQGWLTGSGDGGDG